MPQLPCQCQQLLLSNEQLQEPLPANLPGSRALLVQGWQWPCVVLKATATEGVRVKGCTTASSLCHCSCVACGTAIWLSCCSCRRALAAALTAACSSSGCSRRSSELPSTASCSLTCIHNLAQDNSSCSMLLINRVEHSMPATHPCFQSWCIGLDGRSPPKSHIAARPLRCRILSHLWSKTRLSAGDSVQRRGRTAGSKSDTTTTHAKMTT